MSNITSNRLKSTSVYGIFEQREYTDGTPGGVYVQNSAVIDGSVTAAQLKMNTPALMSNSNYAAYYNPVSKELGYGQPLLISDNTFQGNNRFKKSLSVGQTQAQTDGGVSAGFFWNIITPLQYVNLDKTAYLNKNVFSENGSVIYTVPHPGYTGGYNLFIAAENTITFSLGNGINPVYIIEQAFQFPSDDIYTITIPLTVTGEFTGNLIGGINAYVKSYTDNTYQTEDGHTWGNTYGSFYYTDATSVTVTGITGVTNQYAKLFIEYGNFLNDWVATVTLGTPNITPNANVFLNSTSEVPNSPVMATRFWFIAENTSISRTGTGAGSLVGTRFSKYDGTISAVSADGYDVTAKDTNEIEIRIGLDRRTKYTLEHKFQFTGIGNYALSIPFSAVGTFSNGPVGEYSVYVTKYTDSTYTTEAAGNVPGSVLALTTSTKTLTCVTEVDVANQYAKLFIDLDVFPNDSANLITVGNPTMDHDIVLFCQETSTILTSSQMSANQITAYGNLHSNRLLVNDSITSYGAVLAKDLTTTGSVFMTDMSANKLQVLDILQGNAITANTLQGDNVIANTGTCTNTWNVGLETEETVLTNTLWLIEDPLVLTTNDETTRLFSTLFSSYNTAVYTTAAAKYKVETFLDGQVRVYPNLTHSMTYVFELKVQLPSSQENYNLNVPVQGVGNYPIGVTLGNITILVNRYSDSSYSTLINSTTVRTILNAINGNPVTCVIPANNTFAKIIIRLAINPNPNANASYVRFYPPEITPNVYAFHRIFPTILTTQRVFTPSVKTGTLALTAPPTKTTETSVLYYDPTTKAVSFGDAPPSNNLLFSDNTFLGQNRFQEIFSDVRVSTPSLIISEPPDRTTETHILFYEPNGGTVSFGSIWPDITRGDNHFTENNLFDKPVFVGNVVKENYVPSTRFWHINDSITQQSLGVDGLPRTPFSIYNAVLYTLEQGYDFFINNADNRITFTVHDTWSTTYVIEQKFQFPAFGRYQLTVPVETTGTFTDNLVSYCAVYIEGYRDDTYTVKNGFTFGAPGGTYNFPGGVDYFHPNNGVGFIDVPAIDVSGAYYAKLIIQVNVLINTEGSTMTIGAPTITPSVNMLLSSSSDPPILNRWVILGQAADEQYASIAVSVDGSNWTNLPIEENLLSSGGKSVAWNGNLWVAAGGGTLCTIATSLDGQQWTPTGNSLDVFASRAVCVAWDGNMWMAGGDGYEGALNTLAYSYDGKWWKGLGNAVFSDFCNGVAGNGQIWVAVGYGTVHTLGYSLDGFHWVGLGKQTFSFNAFGVTFGNTLCVAVGSGTNSIAYSADGQEWIGIGTDIFATGYGVTTSGNRWVAVGDGDNFSIAYSDDGINWVGVPGSKTIFSYGRGVDWNGTLWVAVGYGYDYSIAYSEDGINWVGLATSKNVMSSGNAVAFNGRRKIKNSIRGTTVDTTRVSTKNVVASNQIQAKTIMTTESLSTAALKITDPPTKTDQTQILYYNTATKEVSVGESGGNNLLTANNVFHGTNQFQQTVVVGINTEFSSWNTGSLWLIAEPLHLTNLNNSNVTLTNTSFSLYDSEIYTVSSDNNSYDIAIQSNNTIKLSVVPTGGQTIYVIEQKIQFPTSDNYTFSVPINTVGTFADLRAGDYIMYLKLYADNTYLPEVEPSFGNYPNGNSLNSTDTLLTIGPVAITGPVYAKLFVEILLLNGENSGYVELGCPTVSPYVNVSYVQNTAIHPKACYAQRMGTAAIISESVMTTTDTTTTTLHITKPPLKTPDSKFLYYNPNNQEVCYGELDYLNVPLKMGQSQLVSSSRFWYIQDSFNLVNSSGIILPKTAFSLYNGFVYTEESTNISYDISVNSTGRIKFTKVLGGGETLYVVEQNFQFPVSATPIDYALSVPISFGGSFSENGGRIGDYYFYVKTYTDSTYSQENTNVNFGNIPTGISIPLNEYATEFSLNPITIQGPVYAKLFIEIIFFNNNGVPSSFVELNTPVITPPVNLFVTTTLSDSFVSSKNVFATGGLCIQNNPFHYVPWTTITGIVAGTTFGSGVIASVTSPTPATDSTTIYTYSIVGNTMYLRFTYKNGTTNAGGAGNGTYLYSVPSGYSVDMTQVLFADVLNGTDMYGTKSGQAQINVYNSSSGFYGSSLDATVYCVGNTSLAIFIPHSASGSTGVPGTAGSIQERYAYHGSGLYPYSESQMCVTFEASFPIGEA